MEVLVSGVLVICRTVGNRTRFIVGECESRRHGCEVVYGDGRGLKDLRNLKQLIMKLSFVEAHDSRNKGWPVGEFGRLLRRTHLCRKQTSKPLEF